MLCKQNHHVSNGTYNHSGFADFVRYAHNTPGALSSGNVYAPFGNQRIRKRKDMPRSLKPISSMPHQIDSNTTNNA